MKGFVFLLGAGLVVAPLQAQSTAPEVPGFSAKGDGSWEMLCHVIDNGEQRTVIAGPLRDSYRGARLVKAVCEYHASAKGNLVITMIDAEKCPFKGHTVDACALTVPKGGGGSFEFRVKTPR